MAITRVSHIKTSAREIEDPEAVVLEGEGDETS